MKDSKKILIMIAVIAVIVSIIIYVSVSFSPAKMVKKGIENAIAKKAVEMKEIKPPKEVKITDETILAKIETTGQELKEKLNTEIKTYQKSKENYVKKKKKAEETLIKAIEPEKEKPDISNIQDENNAEETAATEIKEKYKKMAAVSAAYLDAFHGAKEALDFSEKALDTALHKIDTAETKELLLTKNIQDIKRKLKFEKVVRIGLITVTATAVVYAIFKRKK